jgi:hypothetical protein
MGALAGADPRLTAAGEAAKRLERSRFAALNRALAERRRSCAAEVAFSLAELLCLESAERSQAEEWV